MSKARTQTEAFKERTVPPPSFRAQWQMVSDLANDVNGRSLRLRARACNLQLLHTLPNPQIEKLVPQPQEAVALGLWTLKDWPIRSSTKSISEPPKYSSETGSISTRAPARSITRSSGSGWPTRSNLYWNPEQPPDRKNT